MFNTNIKRLFLFSLLFSMFLSHIGHAVPNKKANYSQTNGPTLSKKIGSPQANADSRPAKAAAVNPDDQSNDAAPREDLSVDRAIAEPALKR